MTIGIYGGTFDPLHMGHAMIASYASQFAGVDEVWLMVSRLNPLKAGTHPVSEADRLEMARLAAAECSRVRVSDFEMNLPLPSYTYRTLRALRDAYPEHDFRLIVGADNLRDFDKWKNPEEIINEFGLIVFPRPGVELNQDDLPDNVCYLHDAPTVDISSTFLRGKLASGADLTYLVPPAVSRYIREHGLYR